MENEAGFTAPTCKSTIGYVFDAIMGVKGVLIILINIQGYLWWRRKT
jgi:hypothetical protein